MSDGADGAAAAPSAGGGAAEDAGPELEERCWTVETTMRRMLMRNSRLIWKVINGK